MNPWAPLLSVQDLDTRLRQIDHRLAQLPERAERDAIDAELARVRSEIEAAEAAKHDLVRAQKRIEDEIALIAEKVAAEEAKLYGEGSTDPGHLQDLQAEITGLKRKISALEDDELDLMEQVEPIDATLVALADERAELDRRAEQANVALAEAEGTLGTDRDAAEDERRRLVGEIDETMVARYDKVRASLGGIAVAALEHGSCGACHIKLSAVEYDRVQHLPADAEIECEECGRFLVRPVG